jgi:DNA repair exonuclease SbcCD ATPase subunit
MSIVIHPQVLRIRDFRTFTAEQTLTFHDSGPLLGVVGGVNEVEPDLGANGTGKSTLWDALSWCLFGKTVRGVRGSAVIPWEQEEAATRVEFTFRRNGERITVARTMAPNTLKVYRDVPGVTAKTSGLVGENVGQDTVDELVGLTWPMFVSTVVRGQFDKSFLDETPKGKLAFLSQALDLSVWEDAADMATAEKKSLKDKGTQQARDLARAEGALEAAQTALDEIQKFVKDEEDREALRVQAHLTRAHEFDLQWKSAQDELIAAEAERTATTEELNAHLAELAGLEADQAKAREAMAELSARHTTLLAASGAAEHGVSMLEGAGGSCGTCGSELDEKAAQRLRDTAQKALLNLTESGHRMARKEALLEEVGDCVEACKAQVKSVEGDLAGIERDMTRIRGLMVKHSSAANNEVALSKGTAAPSARQLDGAEGRVRAAALEVQELSDAHAATSRELTRADFWSKGFGDVRLWLLRGALDELEALVNSHTLALGLRGWRVAFDVERETKSGGIAKGFTALITSPTTSEPVPYESWSGGELQRLKVAVQAALIDLIRSRTGGGWRFEVWDEPTQHLSSTGISDLINFLRDRSRTQNLEVWVVDHRTLTDGSFQSQITVTKKDSGSRVGRKAR